MSHAALAGCTLQTYCQLGGILELAHKTSVNAALSATTNIPACRLEDISMGNWVRELILQGMPIQRLHDHRFMFGGCVDSKEALVAHPCSGSQMRLKFENQMKHKLL